MDISNFPLSEEGSVVGVSLFIRSLSPKVASTESYGLLGAKTVAGLTWFGP